MIPELLAVVAICGSAWAAPSITAEEANEVVMSFPEVCGDFGFPEWELVPLRRCGQQVCILPQSVCSYNYKQDSFRCYHVPGKCQDRMADVGRFLSDNDNDYELPDRFFEEATTPAFVENRLPPEGNIMIPPDHEAFGQYGQHYPDYTEDLGSLGEGFDSDSTYIIPDYGSDGDGGTSSEIDLPPLPDGFEEPVLETTKATTTMKATTTKAPEPVTLPPTQPTTTAKKVVAKKKALPGHDLSETKLSLAEARERARNAGTRWNGQRDVRVNDYWDGVGSSSSSGEAPWSLGSEKAKDWHKNCCFWALHGECPRNRRFMLSVCQKSCGSYGCTDNYDRCPFRVNTEACRFLRQPPHPDASLIGRPLSAPVLPVSPPRRTLDRIGSSTPREELSGVFHKVLQRLRQTGFNVVPVNLLEPVKK